MSHNEVINANNLARYYPVKKGGIFSKTVLLKALDGVSFSISKGQTLAIVGESGCGKTTIARLITMIEAPTKGTFTINEIEVTLLAKSERRRLRKEVQMVFQDPYGSLNPRKKVGSILEEPLKINTSYSSAQRRDLVMEMMEKVGLSEEQYNRYPHMFSGGQRQRIAVARALMLNPSLVVADEPVSALDVSVQAQAINLLMDIQDEMNLAYLFISHDLSVVRHIADNLLVMYLGRPVEQGEKKVIFDKPLHPYTRALMASTPWVEKGSRRKRVSLSGELPSPLDPPPGCAFHKRCIYMTGVCTQERPRLRFLMERQIACHHAEKLVAEPL